MKEVKHHYLEIRHSMHYLIFSQLVEATILSIMNTKFVIDFDAMLCTEPRIRDSLTGGVELAIEQ